MTIEAYYVFVYGSLMEGFPLHSYLGSGTLVSKACVAGNLLSLGDYPGLVEGDGTVKGELYRCDDLRNLASLDRVERFDPLEPQNSLFQRVLRAVTLSDGSSQKAWVYMLSKNDTEALLIPGGDWRGFVNSINARTSEAVPSVADLEKLKPRAELQSTQD